MTNALTSGVHHVGLSVSDLEETQRFFCQILGFSEAGAVPDYPAAFVSDGTTLITLWQVADPQTANGFDRRGNIGLHHLALSVKDDEALGEVFARVKADSDATIEFAPEPIRDGAAVRHFICTIPGGIRIEFATPFA